MIINYGDFIKIPIELDKQQNKKSLLDKLINHVYYMRASSELTRDALKMAHDVLKKNRREHTRQFAVVFADGQSTNHWYKSGFQATREAALRLRSSGVQLISVGVGFTIDQRELHAIASYPKVKNTFIMRNYDNLFEKIHESFRGFFSSKFFII